MGRADWLRQVRHRAGRLIRPCSLVALAAIAWPLAAQEPGPPDFLPPVTSSLLPQPAASEMLRFVTPSTSRTAAGQQDTIRIGARAGDSQLVVLEEPVSPTKFENLPPTTAAAPASTPQLLPVPAREQTMPAVRRFQLASRQADEAASDDGTAEATDGGDAGADDQDQDAKKEAGDKKEPQKFGREPETTTMQFLRTQDVLLKPCTWQFDTGFAYAHFENQFPVGVVDPNTGYLYDVLPGSTRNRLLYSPLAARYGWSENVQLFGALPVGWSNIESGVLGNTINQNSGGIGDLTAGASVHLFGAQDDLPDVIGTFSFTAPTGDFNAPVFGIVPGGALGQGFWAAAAQLLCINQYDPIVVYYGAGYRHLFKREFNDVMFTPGEQINYLLGVGFAVNDRVTLSSTFQGFYISDFALRNQFIPGSNLEPISVRLAATITRRGHILEPFVYLGLTPSAPDALFGITLTYY